MIGMAGLQRPDEARPVRPGWEMEQVGRTAAVRRPEIRQGHGTAQGLKQRRPMMLPARGIVAVPQFDQRGVAAQVVDMPVRARGEPGMVRDPPSQPAGTQSAADIDTTARLQAQFAQFAGGQRQRLRDRQQQGIGAGARLKIPRTIIPQPETWSGSRAHGDREPAARVVVATNRCARLSTITPNPSRVRTPSKLMSPGSANTTSSIVSKPSACRMA